MSLVPASKAVEYLALLRAIEFNRPQNKRLFTDPYARLFLPPVLKVVEKLSRIYLLNRFIAWIIDKHWTGALTACCARTRLIDVMTVNTIQDEAINQVIIFGAGYDCRALRLHLRKRVQFVEIDHPVLQKNKREKLRQATSLLHNDAQINYLSVDLNTQKLEEILPFIIHKAHYKTLFIWEGVTNSLTAPVAPIAFEYFKRFNPGTYIIFTYVDKEVLKHPEKFKGAVNVTKLLHQSNEDWNFGLDPAQLDTFLTSYNMQLLYEADLGRIRNMYYGKETAAKMKGYEYYRVAMAVVK